MNLKTIPLLILNDARVINGSAYSFMKGNQHCKSKVILCKDMQRIQHRRYRRISYVANMEDTLYYYFQLRMERT